MAFGNALNVQSAGAVQFVTGTAQFTSGTLPVGSGGTGAITLTGVLTGNGTGAITANAVTQFAVIVGGASNAVASVGPSATSGQILQSAGVAANPAFSTATYPSTTTANQILYSTAANTVGQLTAAANSVLTTNATSVPTLVSMATDGSLIIGSASGAPLAATLTAGTGVTILNAANSITISASGSGLSWTNVTGTSQAISPDNGYVSNNGSLVTLTLPSTAAFGSVIQVTGLGAGGWQIAQNASQSINYGSVVTTTGTGGYLASSNKCDGVTLVCVVANTTWNVVDFVGNILYN